MEPKRLMVAAGVLALLAGALWWSNKEEANKDKKPGPDDPPKVLEIPQDQIARVEIQRMGGETVVLEKPDAWRLKAPRELPADAEAVSGLLSTLSVLNSDRLVDEKVADFAPYGFQTPILTVAISRKDGKSHTLRIGSDTPTGSAAYARLDGDPRLFTVAAFTKTSLDKTWRDLRDKRLMPFDADSLTRVETGALEFGKNNANNWTLLKPRQVRTDNFAAEELIRKIREAKFEAVNDVTEEESWPRKFAAAAVVGVAKVTDKKGTMQVEIRKDKDNAYFAKSSAVEGVFKTSAELGEALGKKLDDYRNKKLFEFGFAEPDKVEVKQDGASFVFAKSGTGWTKDGKSVEPGDVQQLIDRLRDLTGTGFADSATGAVFAEYTVKSEKVVISKQGDKYFARRADSTEVVTVEAAVVAEIKEKAAAIKQPDPAKKQ